MATKYSPPNWAPMPELCRYLGLTRNNALLIVDKVLLPYVDLFTWRLVAALVAMLVLLYGLIWDAE